MTTRDLLALHWHGGNKPLYARRRSPAGTVSTIPAGMQTARHDVLSTSLAKALARFRFMHRGHHSGLWEANPEVVPIRPPVYTYSPIGSPLHVKDIPPAALVEAKLYKACQTRAAPIVCPLRCPNLVRGPTTPGTTGCAHPNPPMPISLVMFQALPTLDIARPHAQL